MSFADRVYEAVKAVPAGRVSTYGRIAEACGSPRAARAVGNVLHGNPDSPETPCHRVVSAGGRLAERFANGGAEGQRRLLEGEGVRVSPDMRVDLDEYLCAGARPIRGKDDL